MNYDDLPVKNVGWIDFATISHPGIPIGLQVKFQRKLDFVIRINHDKSYEGFHKWGVPSNGWFIRENPI